MALSASANSGIIRSAKDGDPVAEACVKKITAAAGSQMKRGQKIGNFQIDSNTKPFNVLFEVRKDRGNQNFCSKTGHAQVKFTDRDCQVIELEVEEDLQFTCG